MFKAPRRAASTPSIAGATPPVMGTSTVVPIRYPHPHIVYKVFDPDQYEGRRVEPSVLRPVPDGKPGELYISVANAWRWATSASPARPGRVLRQPRLHMLLARACKAGEASIPHMELHRGRQHHSQPPGFAHAGLGVHAVPPHWHLPSQSGVQHLIVMRLPRLRGATVLPTAVQVPMLFT